MRLLLLNGSPRGPKGNTPIMLERIGAGWVAEGGDPAEMLDLSKPSERARATEAFGEGGTVILGMPLYTDAMPGLVMEFIESLEPYIDKADNPRLGFLVQSGFDEALHSRHLERYLEKLARRLGCEYAGTVIKGGGEGTRIKPESWNRKLFGRLNALGASLARGGRFDPDELAVVAGTERFSALQVAAMRAVNATPAGHWYWDSQLKRNDAFSDRFARPYA